MTPIGASWQHIQDALRLFGQDDLSTIQRRTQASYYRLCEMTDWQRLRRNMTFTAAAGASGAILPADLIGIVAVRDADGNQYDPCEEQNATGDGRYPRRAWFYRQEAVEPLYAGKSITIAKDSISFTASPAVTSAMIGEYMRVGTDPGYYKIASTTTLATRYRGPDIEAKSYVVRPPTTRRLCITDVDGDLTGGTYQVFYWAYPEPLWQDWQVPLLPSTRAVELLAIIDCMGTIDKQEKAADNYRQEFIAELSRMQSQNPKFSPPVPPKDHQGNRRTFGWR